MSSASSSTPPMKATCASRWRCRRSIVTIPSYGTPAYLSVFECQLTELLTNYGAVDELWLWQAPGAPTFDWAAIRDLVHRLQPQTLLELANAAPMAASDVRSIGLSAPGTAASPTDQSSVQSPAATRGPPPTSPPRRSTRLAPAGSGTRPRTVR